MTNRIARYAGTGPLVMPNYLRCQTRGESLRCAMEGLREAWRVQVNFRLQVYLGTVVVAFGVWVQLSLLEWLWVSFAIGLVLFAELMNTAIEQTVDLVVELRLDPQARRIKDISAGCVLVAASIAVVIGLLIFLPHVVRAL